MSSLAFLGLVAALIGIITPKAAKGAYLKRLIPYSLLKFVFYSFSTLFVAGITVLAFELVMGIFNNKVVAIVVSMIVFIPGITRYLGENIPHSLRAIGGFAKSGYKE